MSVRDAAFSAVRWTTASTIGKAGLQFLQVVVLARMLTPGDFGLMAIVMAVIAFVQSFSDLGLSNAIIHYRDVNDDELSSLYWLNLVSGIMLTLAVLAFSPLVADLYHDSRLNGLLALAGFSLTITAAGQQLRVRAERGLHFGMLAIIELCAALCGFVVAAVTAVLMRDPVALVAGLLAGSTTLTVLSWVFLSHGWRPRARYRWTDTRRFLSFGGYSVLGNLIGTVNSQADVAIGGRMFSHVELGAYSMARDLSLRLASLTNPVITRVGLPMMARDHANKEFVGGIYGKTISSIAALNFPLYLGVAAFAPEVVIVLFGERWVDSAVLLRVLAIWGMVRSLMNPVGSLLYACGRAKAAFRWNVCVACLTVPAYVIGSHWGGMGLAVSQLILMLLVFGPCWRYLVYPDSHLELSVYLGLMAKPLVLSALAVAGAFVCTFYLHASSTRLAAALAVSAVFYVALSWRFNRVWVDTMSRLMGRP